MEVQRELNAQSARDKNHLWRNRLFPSRDLRAMNLRHLALFSENEPPPSHSFFRVNSRMDGQSAPPITACGVNLCPQMGMLLPQCSIRRHFMIWMLSCYGKEQTD